MWIADGLNSKRIWRWCWINIATGSTKDGQKTFEFTENATEAFCKKNQVNQIKNALKQTSGKYKEMKILKVKNHTTEFANKKVGENKDDSIDAAKNYSKTRSKEDRYKIGRKK